ncbi:hypothetical protein M0M57_13100 [Flavobacterium azooxidireducens]|uniref:Lipocalin-like domain-containing protein n=1 Tax=Flavobacterium azooxidireducens TaxID=1871076 RepID=A0ABY4KFK3_9FLAO|nr:hypothetical protein [Flavobacterium azooxidireducens]UPQ78553.1 hypothetical protein M0M57_13100 [Flavobacterium azooxidireducens]
MKKLLIIALLISNYCQSQCNEMIVTNDDVSETTTIKSEKIVINDLSITVWCFPHNKSLYILDFIVKDKCVDYESEIIICFKNGEKVKWYNTSYNFNCKGQSAFKISQKNKKLFTTEEISLIRVGTNKENFYQVELNDEESAFLLKTLQCAYNREDWSKLMKYKQ